MGAVVHERPIYLVSDDVQVVRRTNEALLGDESMVFQQKWVRHRMRPARGSVLEKIRHPLYFAARRSQIPVTTV